MVIDHHRYNHCMSKTDILETLRDIKRLAATKRQAVEWCLANLPEGTWESRSVFDDPKEGIADWFHISNFSFQNESDMVMFCVVFPELK